MDKCFVSCIFPSKAAVLWLIILSLLATMVAMSFGEAFEESVRRECTFTRYPSHCVDALLATKKLGLGTGHQYADLVILLVEKTKDETTKLPFFKLPNPNHQLGGMKGQQPNVAIDYCEELMRMSVKRLDQSLSALKGSPQKSKQDIQTWLSAVLTYHDSCKDSISDDPPNRSLISAQISSKMDYLSFLASNSLALANRIPDRPTTSTSTRRQASEHVFPNWVSAEDRRALLDTNTIKADAVVAQDGTGDYKTISEAIKAASGGRFVIYVKAGTYKEKISTGKDNIMLVGDGKDATMITDDRSVGGGSTMPNSATFVITGDGFIAKDIGFSNTAGAAREQALAVRVASDHSVFYRCSFRGYQDTLYALSLRQFYRDCDIYGTIDFIFGNAAAVFQNCNIILRRPAKGHHNTILANGRTDPGQNTGFSLQKCRIRAGPEFYPERHTVASYLGRPWKEYSRAVVMQSRMDDSIWRKGWDEWSGGFALKTLYFAEYANVGPGAGTAGRVGWAGYHVIGAGDAAAFTVGKFISGGSWLPSTGVDFDAGL